MNSFTHKIKNIFSSLTHSLKSRVSDKIAIQPARDWAIMVPTFFFAFILLGVYAYYFYVNVQQGTFWSTVSADESSPVYKINQKNLENVTRMFDQKKQNLEKIQSNPISPFDPFL